MEKAAFRSVVKDAVTSIRVEGADKSLLKSSYSDRSIIDPGKGQRGIFGVQILVQVD